MELKHDQDDDVYGDWRENTIQQRRIEAMDWDVLVVYDGCRWDAMKLLLEDHFDDPPEVEQLQTPTNSGTTMWTDIVWRGEWPDVTYVAGNPQSHNVRNYDDLGIKLEEHVDKFIDATNSSDSEDGCWDFSLGTSRPELITERALKEEPPLVVHYLQPHIPFVGKLSLKAPPGGYLADVDEKRSDKSIAIYSLIKSGHISKGVARDAYLENLRYAWRGSKELRHEFDNVVLTADHGTALGADSGWGHGGTSNPEVKVVPWVEL